MTFYKKQRPKGEDQTPTSPDLWRPLARAIGGFDLDPAAGCEPEQIASKRYTVQDDGLTQPWFGKVWLNPPFSEKTDWYRRLCDQYVHGDVERAVALAPTDTASTFFQRWFSTCDVLGLLKGRDQYAANQGNGGSPSFSTAVGVWNPTDELVRVLHRKGVVCNVESPPGKQMPITQDAEARNAGGRAE